MDTVFQADVATLSLIVGVVLPILVGVVTKELASGGLKATLLALFSGVAGLVNGAINADGVFTRESLYAAATTWVIAVATYYGYWKPTGAAQKVAQATDKAGIGVGGSKDESDHV